MTRKERKQIIVNETKFVFTDEQDFEYTITGLSAIIGGFRDSVMTHTDQGMNISIDQLHSDYENGIIEFVK